MKTGLLKFIVWSFVIVILASCSDDDDNKSKSSLTFEGETFPISEASLRYYEGSQAWTIELSANELENDRYGEILLKLTSDSDSSIPAGTYTFASIDEEDPFHFISALIYITEVKNGFEDEIDGLESGKVIVEKSGTTYTITFDGKVDGKAFSGKYVGAAEIVD